MPQSLQCHCICQFKLLWHFHLDHDWESRQVTFHVTVTAPRPCQWAGRSTDTSLDCSAITSRFTPCCVYSWLESRAEIINVTYRIDSAIVLGDHHFRSGCSGTRDSSSVLVTVARLLNLLSNLLRLLNLFGVLYTT